VLNISISIPIMPPPLKVVSRMGLALENGGNKD
jgi:hypothetical protein